MPVYINSGQTYSTTIFTVYTPGNTKPRLRKSLVVVITDMDSYSAV